jgi:hypothetical protein
MKCALAILAIFGLSGCALIPPSLTPDVRVHGYVVKAIRVTDQVQFQHDQDECAGAALAQADGFDPLGIVVAGAEGVGNNAASFAINPLAPIAGGAGQAGSVALQQGGISVGAMISDKVRCTDKLATADHSAVVFDSR